MEKNVARAGGGLGALHEAHLAAMEVWSCADVPRGVGRHRHGGPRVSAPPELGGVAPAARFGGCSCSSRTAISDCVALGSSMTRSRLVKPDVARRPQLCVQGVLLATIWIFAANPPTISMHPACRSRRGHGHSIDPVGRVSAIGGKRLFATIANRRPKARCFFTPRSPALAGPLWSANSANR